MLTEVVMFKEIVGVADGIDELPKNVVVVMFSDALGVSDGIFVKLLDVVTVRTRMVVEFPIAGTLVTPPVGAVVVFEIRVTSVKIPELELGNVDLVELTNVGGREDEAAVGRLIVEFVEGVGTLEEIRDDGVNKLGGVFEELMFAELCGITTVAVRTTKVVC